VVRDKVTADRYRELARLALDMQIDSEVSEDKLFADVERQFKLELQEADKWYAELKAKELDWIKTSPQPELEFDRLYATEPVVTEVDYKVRARLMISLMRMARTGVIVLLVIIGLAASARFLMARRGKAAAAAQTLGSSE
jgi:hypothetical protein